MTGQIEHSTSPRAAALLTEMNAKVAEINAVGMDAAEAVTWLQHVLSEAILVVGQMEADLGSLTARVSRLEGQSGEPVVRQPV